VYENGHRFAFRWDARAFGPTERLEPFRVRVAAELMPGFAHDHVVIAEV
jgi:hypothetical protein